MDLEGFFQKITPWLMNHGIKIVLFLIAAWLVKRLLKKFMEKIIRRAIKGVDQEAEKKREATLIRIFNSALTIVVWAVVLMMILDELGINIGPILAGAGVLGLALGFGAQYMIRDFLAGLFIILENQYRVGDVVSLDNTAGLVEDITLRKTVLRDLDGILHQIPNGEIKKSSNFSKEFSRVNLNLGVAYNSNLDKVIEVVNRVGRQLAQDSQWEKEIIKPPQCLGVEDFADSAVIIKILGETKPLKQWDVARELRKRLKIAFDQEGIEIPFPQMAVWPRGQWEK